MSEQNTVNAKKSNTGTNSTNSISNSSTHSTQPHPPIRPPQRSLEEIKAEARAFALSTSTSTSTSNHQNNVKKRHHQLLLSSVLSKHTAAPSQPHHRGAISVPTNTAPYSNSTTSTQSTTTKKRIASSIAGTNQHHHHDHHNHNDDSFRQMISTAIPTTTTMDGVVTPHPGSSSNPPFSKKFKAAPPPQPEDERDDEDDDDDEDDYARFVKILSTLDDQDQLQALVDGDDDEEEFLLEFEEDEEDDDEDEEDEDVEGCETVGGNDRRIEDTDDGNIHKKRVNQDASLEATTTKASDDMVLDIHNNDNTTTDTTGTTHSVMETGGLLPDVSDSFYRELEEELGWLEEEDIEAAVATLLDYPVTMSTSNTGSHGNHNYDDKSSCRDRSESEEPMNDGDHHDPPDESESIVPRPIDENNDESMPADPKQSDLQYQPNNNNVVDADDNDEDLDTIIPGATSPYKSSSSASTNYHHHYRTMITPDQEDQLRTLLQKHHQLLLQQAVLAVRAANAQRRHRYGVTTTTSQTGSPNGKDGGMAWATSPTTANTTTTTGGISIHPAPLSPYSHSEFAHCHETADDIAEILDSAVGMLLDLDENRKDAIRYQIQCESSSSVAAFHDTTTMNQTYPHSESLSSTTDDALSPQRSLYAEFFHERPLSTSSTMMMVTKQTTGSRSTSMIDRRLTRAQFTKKLLDQSLSYETVKTVFNIRGLHKLMPTFNLLDRCVEGVQKGDNNILEIETVRNTYHEHLDVSLYNTNIIRNLILVTRIRVHVNRY